MQIDQDPPQGPLETFYLYQFLPFQKNKCVVCFCVFLHALFFPLFPSWAKEKFSPIFLTLERRTAFMFTS